jgi:predicted ATPase
MPSDNIREISIKGFKSIASLDVTLNPINIGANGSGKSNFLGAFAFLREIAAGRLREYVGRAAGGAERLLHFGSKTTEKIDLHVSFHFPNPESASAYDLTLVPTGDDSLFPSGEVIRTRISPTPFSLSDWQIGREAGVSNAKSGSAAKGICKKFDFWHVYHFRDTATLHKTASLNDNRFLRANGSNLPAVLYHLREQLADSYNLIVHAVRQVAPFFHDFVLNPIEPKLSDIRLEWRHRRLDDQYFDASLMSDGTLRFAALATLLLDPRRDRRSLLLVDEPELGLHPYAIGLLAALIRQAAIDTQIIVSTQSSLLLDNFDPEAVLVADLVDDGTQLSRLDSTTLEKWLEDYSLGQLWEKNEIGGRPGSR